VKWTNFTGSELLERNTLMQSINLKYHVPHTVHIIGENQDNPDCAQEVTTTCL